MSGKLIVTVGPSGVGKGTVLKKVFSQLDNLVYSISVTTRSMRPGELEGVNYFFRTRDQFHDLVVKGEMLEWAEFVGNYYGTPREYVQKQLEIGKNVLLEIEVEGAKQIKKSMPEAVFIFIAPPSLEILAERLRGRSTESEEKIAARVNRAAEELKEKDWFDYFIVNEEGKADETAQKLVEFIRSLN